MKEKDFLNEEDFQSHGIIEIMRFGRSFGRPPISAEYNHLMRPTCTCRDLIVED
jgi:hypothetical protein